MITFTGKNTDFEVIFDGTDQAYYVYYKKKYMNIKAYRYADIASYLD